MLFSGGELKDATGGATVRRSDRPVTCVTVDSRTVAEGALFVPLAGERVNGHAYIGEALSRGASAVLVESLERAGNAALKETLAAAENVTIVEVANTLSALQDLARYHMARYPHVVRIGITGSSGKTTTKELVGSIFSLFAPTAVSKGNLNSEIGVPLSAFQVTQGDEYAVFEMGINHPGEMDILASIVKPNAALITNIGTAHIGLLGSREAIAAEKKKIASFFTDDDVLFLFEEDEFLSFLQDGIHGTVLTYGPRSTQGFTGSRILGLDGTAIDWEGLRIRFPLVGPHNLVNALGAISLAAYCRIPEALIKEGLERVSQPDGRSEILRGRIDLINDSYNANPDSVIRALRFLAETQARGRRIAVLGDMRELGEQREVLHRELGREAGQLAVDGYFFYGEGMEAAYQALAQTSFRGRAFHTTDFSALTTEVCADVRPGDLVLLKGSRAMELERLVGPLMNESGRGA